MMMMMKKMMSFGLFDWINHEDLKDQGCEGRFDHLILVVWRVLEPKKGRIIDLGKARSRVLLSLQEKKEFPCMIHDNYQRSFREFFGKNVLQVGKIHRHAT